MELIETQRKFTQYLRTMGATSPPDDVAPERLAVYRELLFKNIESILSSNFPVLHKVLTDQYWHELISDFFTRHFAQAPLFTEISLEFLVFLQNERQNPSDPPFLIELAHYEWVELAVFIDESEVILRQQPTLEEVLCGKPVLNPTAQLLCYHFPVHRIRADHQPQTPSSEPHYFVVYRNTEHKVNFIELNIVSAKLLSLLENNTKHSGFEILKLIAEELNHPQPDLVIQSGNEMLEFFMARDVLTISVEVQEDCLSR